MYRAGIEDLLGIRREGATLIVDPCIPRAWPGYEATIALPATVAIGGAATSGASGGAASSGATGGIADIGATADTAREPSPAVQSYQQTVMSQGTEPHGTTRYAIRVENPAQVSRGIASATLDDAPIEPVDGRLRLPLDGGDHRVTVVLGD
jgi:hypothetical protein